MKLSIIIPIYNERENLGPLHAQLSDVLQREGQPYELIFVDDGSRDGSCQLLQRLAHTDPCLRVVCFRRNYGQTAALQAGLEHADGEIVVTIDGDLQNDPRDIPKLVKRLHDGYDLAHGWRRNRQDAWASRVVPSKIANALISRTTGVAVHDLGCTLKAMRREIADDLELYGQMHRFIPILAAQRGARCVEVVTHHRPRLRGQSKYGMARTFQVVLDLLTVQYLLSYFANPMRLFGKLAAGCATLGLASILCTVVMKVNANVDMTGNPLLLVGMFCGITATQFVSLGLLGEVAARIYYRRGGHRPFAIARTIGFDDSRDNGENRIRQGRQLSAA